MGQGSNIFWFSFCIAIAVSVGCDGLNNTKNENKLEMDQQAARSPTTADSVENNRAQETVASRMIDLEVDVSGFGNCNGTCRIAVYFGNSHFNEPEFAIAKESIRIADLKANWQVQIAIPEETNRDVEATSGIAISAYHDENENARLDKNAFGIPTERYGFSKNPKRGYGPPKFGETGIELFPAKQISDSNSTLIVPIQIK